MANTTTHATSAINPSAPQTHREVPPSNTVDPTRVHTAPQQAATEPEDGTRVESPDHMPTTSPTAPSGPVTFKEQVIAYAKKTRGTILRKSTLQEHGDQILAGEASAWEPTKKA